MMSSFQNCLKTSVRRLRTSSFCG